VFTRIRTLKPDKTEVVRNVLTGSCAQRERTDWIRQAIEALKDADGLERIGVWLEAAPAAEEHPSPVIFRGEVWERDGGNPPVEWTHLSGDSPLPQEVLSNGRSVEHQLGESYDGPILGPLVGLERALWVPVTSHKALRGLVLVGTREKHRSLPLIRAEQVAAELGWLLEFEEEQRVSRLQKADLALIRRLHAFLGAKQDSTNMLQELAQSCTRQEKEGGVGVVFALIGELQSESSMEGVGALKDDRLRISAHSGDPAWSHSVTGGQLEKLWRLALRSRRIEGAEPDRLPLAKNISLVVAVPLESGGRKHGVLLAGISRHTRSLEVLGRLELRAQLAVQVLEQRQAAEVELRYKSWQKVLLDSSPEMLLLVHRNGYLLGMSPGARKLFSELDSVDRETVRKCFFAEQFRPQDREEINRWIQREFSPEGNENSEVMFSAARNGAEVLIFRKGVAEGDYVAVGIEFAEGRLVARGIPEVEAELRQTLEWLEEGVLIVDAAGCIRAMNSRVQQMLGLTVEDARQMRTIEELILHVSRNSSDPEGFSARWRALSTDGDYQGREELVMEWPVPQVIERCTRQIIGNHGKQLGRVEVYQEMTARRIFQSRMLQTEKLASLGQRAIGIVHELTTPMTTILVNAQRLVLRSSESGPNPEARSIFEEAERATSILRQLLYVSRETRPVRQRIDLRDLVDRTMQLQKASLAGNCIELRVEHETPLLSVAGDFAQLQQVLLNLLQNAQQAIEQSGTGTIIGVRTSRYEETHVRLEVWDNGPGIPPAIQARIYDPFFTTKANGEGTGLGLSIALGFVRQHGGTISQLSSPQGGSRFIVELPVAAGIPVTNENGNQPEPVFTPRVYRGVIREEPQNEHGNGQLPVSGGKLPQQTTLRVLVVEDEPTVAALIADLLREEGMNVDVLMDSRPAVRQIERESYDLLICDLKMPGTDGLTLYRTLLERRHPLHKNVLFVTGDVLAQRSQEFLGRHNLPYVAKPFHMEELREAVHKILLPNNAVKNGATELSARQLTGNG
jgi:signal transduction histidine kinase/CheY-like chemotaxis protein